MIWSGSKRRWRKRCGLLSVPMAVTFSIDHVEGKTVYVKLLGQCAGCPSADLTNETIVEAELKAALPDLVEKAVVVQTVSDELWEQAKKLLREHHL